MQPAHRRVACLPFVAALLTQRLQGRARGSNHARRRLTRLCLRYEAGECCRDRPAVAADRGTQRVAEIAQEVPPIADLDGSRGVLPDGTAKHAGAVARDDLHTRVLLEPGLYRLGLSVRQQVNDFAAFQVVP